LIQGTHADLTTLTARNNIELAAATKNTDRRSFDHAEIEIAMSTDIGIAKDTYRASPSTPTIREGISKTPQATCHQMGTFLMAKNAINPAIVKVTT
jgi:hypothetical protein